MDMDTVVKMVAEFGPHGGIVFLVYLLWRRLDRIEKAINLWSYSATLPPTKPIDAIDKFI